MTPELEAGLKEALTYSGGTHSLRDVEERIKLGQAQYWEEGNAAMVTEIREEPQMRVLHLWLAAGDLEDVLVLHDRVIEWGRSIGCKGASLAGRKGWVKALASRGWESQLVLMGRKI